MTNQIESKKPKIVATVATMLLVASVVYLTVELGRNDKLENQLRNEKLSAESLLSQKLAGDKEILRFTDDIGSMKEKNRSLEQLLNTTSIMLKEKEETLRNLEKQKYDAVRARRQNQALQKLNGDLEQQLEYYKLSVKEMQVSNNDFLQTISVLQQQTRELTEALQAARLASINNVSVEAIKGNRRLTVNAKKTRQLIVHAEIPAEADNLKFRIRSPEGKELPLDNKNFTVKVNTVEKNARQSSAFYASSEGNTWPANTYKEVQLIYAPQRKLTTGVYEIEMTNNDKTIGKLKLRLK